MNTRQYIESGIIESYALGLASPAEVAEFEKILPFYPDIQSALADFEYQLELFAMQSEIPPPPAIRGKLEGYFRDLPAIKPVYRKEGAKGKSQQEEFIPVQVSSTHMWVHKYWRPVFLAVFLLSKIFLILFIYYFIKYQHAERDILQMQLQMSRTAPASGSK